MYPLKSNNFDNDSDDIFADDDSDMDEDMNVGPDTSVPAESFDPDSYVISNKPAEEEDLPTAINTGLKGILDQAKQNKVAAKQQKQSTNALFLKWFEKYLNAIFQAFYTEQGSVKIVQGHEGGFINLDSNSMVLYDKLIIDLWESGVPPLLVFYHEIGHLLFTDSNITSIGSSLNKEVFMLLNWLEDFYIEERLMKELYFIKPYIKDLHQVVPDFINDWQRPEFAFNYYYAFEGMVPQWMSQTNPPIDGKFKHYINTLLNLRKTISSKFAQQRFLNELDQFYQFCVAHGILNQATPPPPTQPQPQQNAGGSGAGSGSAAGSGSGRGQGGMGQGQDLDLNGTGTTNSAPGGVDIVDSSGIDPNHQPAPTPTVFKPLDPQKGFNKTLQDLMVQLAGEFDKQLYDAFKLSKRGKEELVPTTRNTTSPRSMVDPIAIQTNQSAIYLEYITEKTNYVGYNLFVDASGSVGHNSHYNSGVKQIIDIIKQYPHNVYSFNDTLIKWGPREIKNVDKLRGTGGTESSLIAPIVLEKREANNLNVVFSDGDLSYLVDMKDFSKIKDKYLFVFFCVNDVNYYTGKLSKVLDPKQFFVYNDIKDINQGLEALKKYIRTKGM